MKDFFRIWEQIAGRTYTAVSTHNNNVRELSSDENTEQHFAQQKELIRKERKQKRDKPKSVVSIALIGLLGLASGCLILFLHPYDFIFKWKITFGEGGEIFELWRRPPVDLYLRVFLWNVTNHEAFLAGREKIKVEEVGPYVYREAMSHENVTFNANGTLTAFPNHPLEWVPEMSEGHQEDDLLILPNIALLSITHVVREASYFTRLGLNLVIRQTNSEPLVKMTAKEFMFGYESKLLTLGNNFMPGWITFDKLGLIDRMYDFDGDFETVYTGETNVTQSGLLDTYRGSPLLPQWEGKHCANIQGASDGTKFQSFIQPNDQLLFFRKSLCRGSLLVRVNDTSRQNLNAYYYTFAPNAMDNGYFNQENKCFCRNGNCLNYGLLDVTDCYYGFPIALSYPHFLYSDPELLNNVEGSHPDPSKHESFFIIQPTSGLPLELAARFQINMAIGDVSQMSKVERFSNMALPLLWMEIRMYSLPDSLATKMALYLNVLPTLEQLAMYCLFIFGSTFIMYSVYKFAQMKNGKSNRIGTQWFDDEIQCDKNRRSSYRRSDSNVPSKELEVYYNSLITPLNQDIHFQEYSETHEEAI